MLGRDPGKLAGDAEQSRPADEPVPAARRFPPLPRTHAATQQAGPAVLLVPWEGGRSSLAGTLLPGAEPSHPARTAHRLPQPMPRRGLGTRWLRAKVAPLLKLRPKGRTPEANSTHQGPTGRRIFPSPCLNLRRAVGAESAPSARRARVQHELFRGRTGARAERNPVAGRHPGRPRGSMPFPLESIFPRHIIQRTGSDQLVSKDRDPRNLSPTDRKPRPPRPLPLAPADGTRAPGEGWGPPTTCLQRTGTAVFPAPPSAPAD